MSSKPVATGKQPEGPLPSNVLWKLLLFSVLMALAPVGSYFGSLKYIWEGSTTYSAITAVVIANVLLVVYVVLAFREDAGAAVATPATVKKKQ